MISRPQPKPISLRLSVTDRCQLRCLYCMPSEGVTKRDHCEILSFEEILRFVGVLKSHYGLSKVHITGGEPLIRPGVVDLIAMLSGEGISDLALTTNGHLLPEMALPLKKAGLNRVNISIDTLVPETYRKLTRRGNLPDTLAGIDAALDAGLGPVKLNTIVMKGVNSDEIVSMARFGLDRGCEVRFLELMPIGPSAEYFDKWYVSSADVTEILSKAYELSPANQKAGGSSRRYIARDAQGSEGFIGLISSTSKPFCGGCRRLRLTASGELVGCLAMGATLNIRPILQKAQTSVSDQLIQVVSEAMSAKRNSTEFITPNLMSMTGG